MSGADLSEPGSSFYLLEARSSCFAEANAIRLVAEAYKMSSLLRDAPLSLESSSKSTQHIKMTRKTIRKSLNEIEEENTITEGLEPILLALSTDYKAINSPPGKKNRLNEDHPWYYLGYRASKHRVLRVFGWACNEFVNGVKESITTLQSQGSIDGVPPEIIKLARSMKLNKFAAADHISLPDLVTFALSHAFLSECLQDESSRELLYSSISETLEFLDWFERMESNPHVQALRTTSQCKIFPRLNILQLPVWPEDFPPFEEMKKSVHEARDSVRNCVTDSTTRKAAIVNDKSLQINDGLTFINIKDKLQRKGWDPAYDVNTLLDDEIVVPWNFLPTELDPSSGGLKEDRAYRKRRQIDNIVRFARSILFDGAVAVDFCGGGGHLALVLAWMFPNVQVHLVDKNAVHLALARRRITKLAASGVELSNIHVHNCDVREWNIFDFHLGMAIHSCGVLCDIVQELCIKADAAYLIVPCCFGSLKNNNASTEITVPRSVHWKEQLEITKHEYDIVCSVADRGSESWKLETDEQKAGKFAMCFIDEDRQHHAKEAGYKSLFHLTLQPPSITPKNEVIIGVPSRLSLKHQLGDPSDKLGTRSLVK